MNYKHLYYPESRFGDFTDLDGSIAFYLRINSLIESSSIVLDVGCGRGKHIEDPVKVRRDLKILKGRCKKVIGIDVDESARNNPIIDEFQLIENDKFNVKTESIDVLICDNVLEHIKFPELFFKECNGVLKKDGFICIRTPNVLNYVALCSKVIPTSVHHKVLGKVQKGRKDIDVFPSYYRCNTKRRLRNMLNKYGFNSVVYRHEAEPSYLSFSRVAFYLGVLHQRLAPDIFKASLFAFGSKI